MNLRERLAKLKGEMMALKKGIEEGDADAIARATELKGEIEAVQAKIKAADDAKGLLACLGNKEGDEAEPKGGEAKPATLGAMAAKSAEDLGLSKGVRGNFVLVKDDPTPGTQTSPGAASTGALTQLAQDIDRNVVPLYHAPLVMRDLLGSETISGNALTYFVEAAESGIIGGFAKVAEGGAKPQVEFPYPTAVTEALAKVASYYVETDELLEDYAWLASSIDGRALYLQRKFVDNVLLNGVKATHGIDGILNRSGIGSIAGTSSAPTALTADNIFAAMMQVQADTGLDADALVINPTDYQGLRLAKDLNGQYYGGGYFFGPYAEGGIAEQPNVWGLRTVVTPAIAQGTALVGAFRQGASVITKAGGGLRVEMTNSNVDDFTHNRVTIRVEERLALAVRYPKAFVKIADYSS